MSQKQPQVPGESQSPSVEQVPQSLDDKISVSASVLADLQAQIARLSQQVLTAGKPQRRPNDEADLPDDSDIDMATLKSPVLTKTGWLVPAEFGRHPNALK
jgi:hypothetical protein